MLALLALTSLATTPQDPQHVLYEDTELGLSFRHPANWQIEDREYSVDFTIPLSTGETATLRLMRSRYRFEAENWQRMQRETNELGGSTVVRQWQEQLLGVPLLMSEIRLARDNGRTTTLVGLLYTNSEEKLLFRLEAPTDPLREAEKAWRDTLLSLRTDSGTLPTAENPTAPPETAPEETKPPETSEPPPVTVIGPEETTVVVRGAVALPFTREGVGLVLLVPAGWTLEETEAGKELVNAALGLRVGFEVGVGGWQGGNARFIELAVADLAGFEKVTLRRDRETGTSKAGGTCRWIERNGPNKSSWIGVCAEQNYWWALTAPQAPQSEEAARALDLLADTSWIQHSE